MPEKFQQELTKLKSDVIAMAELATCFLERSIEALVDQNVGLATTILAMKDEILEIDQDIEKRTLHLLTLYQPMAIDMRRIGTILKIITYITRIGRYGKDIADIVEELSKKPHVKKMVHIPIMRDKTLSMIKDAIEAFRTEKLTLIPADEMIARDDEVDEMRYEIFRECLTYMMEDQSTITRCMHYVMIARYLERCADHACKIAEKVHYMVKGAHMEIK